MRQRPPNFAAGIQSLSFNRSRWHPFARLAADHPLNPAPGDAIVRIRTLLRLLMLSFTDLHIPEDETSRLMLFC